MAGIVWDDTNVALGSLGAGIAVTAASKIDSARLQGFRVLRTEWYMGVTGMTTGEGPLLLGMSVGLSAAQIQGGIQGDPQRSHDVTESDQAQRPIWPLQVFMANADGDGTIVAQGVIKLGWSVPEGVSLNFFVINFTASALTTGAVVNVIAKHFGVWLRD